MPRDSFRPGDRPGFSPPQNKGELVSLITIGAKESKDPRRIARASYINAVTTGAVLEANHSKPGQKDPLSSDEPLRTILQRRLVEHTTAPSNTVLLIIDVGSKSVAHRFLDRHPDSMAARGIAHNGIDAPFSWHGDVVSQLIIEGLAGTIKPEDI